MDDRTHQAAHHIEGRSAAPGIAVGPLVRLAPTKHDARQSRSAAEEHQALVDALAASQADLISLAHEAETMKGKQFSLSRRLSWKTIT